MTYFKFGSPTGREGMEEASFRSEVRVPMLLAMDFDKTLAPVDSTFEYTLELAANHGVDINKLVAARRDIEAVGESFSPFAHIRRAYGDEMAAAIATDMITKGIGAEPHQDAIDLTQRLNEGGVPRFVMSMAEDVLGQYGKILSAGYRGGIMITPTSDKGRWRETYRFGDEYHAAPIQLSSLLYTTREVCLVDDSEEAIRSWKNGPAYWLSRGKKLKGGDLPPNVRQIETLEELDGANHRVVHVNDPPQEADPITHTLLERLQRRADKQVREASGSLAVAAAYSHLQVMPRLNSKQPDWDKVWVGGAL